MSRSISKTAIRLVTSLLVAVSLLLPAAASGTGPVDARPAGPSALINNVFYETDIRQALQDIAAQAQVTIVAEPEVSAYISCDLKDVPLEKALRIVLAGTGYVVTRTPDYYLVSSPYPDGPSFPEVSRTMIIKLNYIKAPEALMLLSEPFRRYVQSDGDNNVLAVTAPAGLAERIASDLALIDRPQRHVLLDARIVVMERGDLMNLGIDWGMPQARAGAFTGSDLDWDWTSAIEIGYAPNLEFTNALLLNLNLLAQNDEATIIASPQVMVQDGHEAEISMKTEEYFEILTDGYYYRSELKKVEAGTALKITPRIGENGEITLDLSAEVSDVVARGKNNLPVVTRRLAQSTLRIEDGGTASVAGLLDTRAQQNQSGIPGLRRFPLVGPVFGSDQKSGSSRQVAVFVTARLLPDGAGDTGEAGVTVSDPLEPVGDEFKEALRESLSRLGRGGAKK